MTTATRTTTTTVELERDRSDVLEETIRATLDGKLKKLDESAERYARELAAPIESRILRMVITSRALNDIRSQLTDSIMQEYVVPLMCSPLGFMCDRGPGCKNPNPYTVGELREAVLQALLQDFRLTENEFNVIAGKFYGAQAGYRRKVREIPGLTNLEEIAGTPVVEAGATKVRMAIRCKIDGKPWELKDQEGKPGRVFVIRVNEGMGADAVIGKAKRKALKAAYEEITGTKITELAGDDDTDADTKPPVGRVNLNGSKPQETQSDQSKPTPVDLGDELAGPDLHEEISREAVRTGTLGAALVAVIQGAGAVRKDLLTIGQAEKVIAELRERPDATNPETATAQPRQRRSI